MFGTTQGQVSCQVTQAALRFKCLQEIPEQGMQDP